MYQIKQTSQFSTWLNAIKDPMTKFRLARRIEKAAKGNLGDVKPVGKGVYEMREFFGKGWRMYYTQRGDTLIIMLGGGNKSTQQKDIKAAQQLAQQIEEIL